MRTTRSEVESVFKLWVAVINGRIAKNYNDVGGYRLDHVTVCGGYTVERVCNESGGVSHPLGTDRLSAYDFVTALRKAMRSIEEMRLNTIAGVK